MLSDEGVASEKIGRSNLPCYSPRSAASPDEEKNYDIFLEHLLRAQDLPDMAEMLALLARCNFKRFLIVGVCLAAGIALLDHQDRSGVLSTSINALEGSRIWTDKEDYAPKELVTIFGEGFNPNSNVRISVLRPDSVTERWETRSDEAGGFATSYQHNGIEDVYRITVTDGKNVAKTTFTDHNSTPNIQEDSLVVTTPSAVTRNSTFNITSTVLAHRTGGSANTNWSVQLSLPSEYSTTSANPQTTSTNSHGAAVVSWTVTAPLTPSGPNTFTITATATDAATGVALSGSPEIDTFSVTTVNTAPLALDDTANTQEDLQVAISVLANDTDSDNDTLLVTSIPTGPSNGTAVIDAGNTTITYTPDTDLFGTDTFSYSLQDGFGGSDTATVTVTVSAVNDPPVALDDAAITSEDTPETISVLSNDTDVDSGALMIVSVTPPDNGNTVIDIGNLTVTYTPSADFNSVDSFDYVISDGDLTDTGTVIITVSAANDSPIAYDANVEVDEDGEITIALEGSDVDSGDSLTFMIESGPNHGTLSNFNPTSGLITYKPDSNYNGDDSFLFAVSDGFSNSTIARISITVHEVAEGEDNEEPVRDRRNNNRDKDELELAARRLTYDNSYFDDNPLKRIQIQSRSILNGEGAMFSSVTKGEEVTFSYSIRNYQQNSQQYYFIIQITDESNLALSIEYAKGELQKGGVTEVELSWSPETNGDYFVKALIWSNLDSAPLPLAELDMMAFNVR